MARVKAATASQSAAKEPVKKSSGKSNSGKSNSSPKNVSVVAPNSYGGRSENIGAGMRVAIIGAGGIANQHFSGHRKAGASIVAFAEPFEATRARRETEWNAR